MRACDICFRTLKEMNQATTRVTVNDLDADGTYRLSRERRYDLCDVHAVEKGEMSVEKTAE